MKAAVKRCQDVAAGKKWAALLWGDYGTGKTHLAIAALTEWVKRENTGYFWKVPDFLQWVRETAFGREEGVDNTLESYRYGMFLLVLDDLGTENRTDWASEQLYRVLDSRYDLKLPTILTTNQAPERIDPRIFSRYREGLAVCEGEDMRVEGHIDETISETKSVSPAVAKPGAGPGAP
jgi:DNA replication protein DnaC